MSDFEVEVVFATPTKQSLKTIVVRTGATVGDVVAMSGVLNEYPDQERGALTTGIWGRAVDESRVVREGDRVELYRSLELDPREARRQLALIGRTMGNADAD